MADKHKKHTQFTKEQQEQVKKEEAKPDTDPTKSHYEEAREQPFVKEVKTEPQPAQPDNSEVSKKMQELEEEIRKARALNESLEAKERELDKKVTEAGTTIDKLSAQDRSKIAALHASKAENMKQALKQENSVQIFVPLEGTEKKGTQLPVTVNGYRVNVPKGVYVKVPETVAQIVMESMNQTQAATDIPQNLANKTESDKEKLS